MMGSRLRELMKATRDLQEKAGSNQASVLGLLRMGEQLQQTVDNMKMVGSSSAHFALPTATSISTAGSVYVRVYACASVSMCVSLCVCMSVCISVPVCVHVHVCLTVCASVCPCVRLYVRLCVCMLSVGLCVLRKSVSSEGADMTVHSPVPRDPDRGARRGP